MNHKKVCKNCGSEFNEDANFCAKCSSKLGEECNCWVLKGAYSCGFDRCPGLRLMTLLKPKKL